MTLYGTALFVHVTFAILLVGGTVWAHVAITQARHQTSLAGFRVQMGYVHGVLRATGPLAIVTAVAGLYLAFAGGWWSAGWPAVAVGLFLVAGGLSGANLDPASSAIAQAAEDTSGETVPDDLRAALYEQRMTVALWLTAGSELALVALMTNKPTLAASLVISTVALSAGAVVGLADSRRATAPRPATTA